MSGWFNFWEARSSWLLLLVFFGSLVAFSFFFMVGDDTAWGKALAAGNGKVPEMLPGLPAAEPGRSLEAIWENGAERDYVAWQIIDFPFAILNVLVQTAALSLFLKKADKFGSVLQLAMWLPVIYFVGEVFENGFVVAFTLKALPGDGAYALMQQIATTIKFGSSLGAGVLTVLSILGALFIDVGRLLKRS